MVKIYTDGACSGNPGKGGWAVIVVDRNSVVFTKSGNEEHTTNNRMELAAFIQALNYIDSNNEEGAIIISDSKYVIDGYEKWLPNWKKRDWKGSDKKPVKNQDLWKEIDELGSKLKFKLQWTKGHAEDQYNDLADRMAVEAVN